MEGRRRRYDTIDRKKKKRGSNADGVTEGESKEDYEDGIGGWN